MANREPTEISHPAIDLTQSISLHSTESRVLLHVRGTLPHVFELREDPKGAVSVHLIEDLEGLGITSVVAGWANRFAVLTEAGDAYLIPRGTMPRGTVEPELLDLSEEDDSTIRMIGVGSNFEVVVTDEHVWIRGQSECYGRMSPSRRSLWMLSADLQMTSRSWASARQEASMMTLSNIPTSRRLGL